MEVTESQCTTAALFAGTFALVYLVIQRISGQLAVGHKRLPPSIGCLPIVGSLPYLPDITNMHTFFASKAQEYGDVLSFKAGKMYTVVLNSHASILEAFVKRSTDCADRPRFSFQKYTNPDRKGIIVNCYNASFKKYHQLSLTILKEFGYGQNLMETRISSEVQQLIQNIKDLDGRAFDAEPYVTSTVMNVISRIIFGRGLDNDERLKRACFTMANNVIKEQRFFAVEIFP
jgi:cytochrome P450